MSDFWSWNNAVDGEGTLLSSPQGSAGELLVSNIRDPRVGKIWRAGATSAILNVQLPRLSAISMVGIFGHNFADLGTMTITLGNSTSSVWQRSFDPDYPQAVFVLRDFDGNLAPVEASWATIYVSGGAPLEIGRVWLGTADWQTEYNHAVNGTNWRASDLSRMSRTPRTGAVLGDRGARRRTFTANYEVLTPGEYGDTLFEMDAGGILQQMLFVPDPDVYDPSRFAILGNLDDLPATEWQAFQTAGRTITITEAG